MASKYLVRAAVAAAIILLSSADSRSQAQHSHHHHSWRAPGVRHTHLSPLHRGWVPGCFNGGFTWDVVIELPIIQQWNLPQPVFIPQPVMVAPAVPPPHGIANNAAGAAENFARKAIGLPRQVVEDVDAFADQHEIRRRVNVLKPSTPGGRMRADRTISTGDRAFADQNYARATAKYRDAISQAPDYAEAHFRLAHAYIATRQYNLALKSVLMALELAGSSERPGFSLEDMYQGDNFVRSRHLEVLQDAARREPDDGGLQLLIGFTLDYSGEAEKARQFFLSAQQSPGMQQPYARYFLPIQRVAEPLAAAN